jgi:glyoxylase-like metal-dependent hydrolase (beta-lactamase superfamily II)
MHTIKLAHVSPSLGLRHSFSEATMGQASSSLEFVPLAELEIPEDCPFSIEKLVLKGRADTETYLIREHDQYGEFPHIYAKICTTTSSSGVLETTKSQTDTQGVIVLSDTGCGTSVPNPTWSQRPASTNSGRARPQPHVWTIGTFFEYTINPGKKLPYLVMTTHCHFDHIMGLQNLPPTTSISAKGTDHFTTVLASSNSKSFISPYENLQKHSLCGEMGIHAPKYQIDWADDMSKVVYKSATRSGVTVSTPYTILHTPGHTPDSLTWYDADLRLLCVGDSFYVKETDTTRKASWGPEPAMPVIFPPQGILKDWWDSLQKLLSFVREENEEVYRYSPKKKTALANSEDEGFVIVDATDARGPAETASRTTPSSAFPAQAKPTSAPQPSAETSSANGQQTGFYVPPVNQRNLTTTAVPSLPSRCTPVIQPDTLIPDANAWMFVGYSRAATQSRPRPPLQRLPRVALCAAHTTVHLDAGQTLVKMQTFMARILKNEVPCVKVEESPDPGEERWLWDDELGGAEWAKKYEAGLYFPDWHSGRIYKRVDYPAATFKFSVLAPWRVIEEGRKTISLDEFRDGIPNRETFMNRFRPAGVV